MKSKVKNEVKSCKLIDRRGEDIVEIYALIDPDSNQIRYIGKANNAQLRLQSHLKDSINRNTPVYSWIRKLTSQNKIPIMQVICRCNKDNWREQEINAIAEYSINNRLLNIALGGDQPYCSIEQRSINGRLVAGKIHSNPLLKKIWAIKQMVGASLKYHKKHNNINAYNKLVDATQYAVLKRPEVFSAWACLECI